MDLCESDLAGSSQGDTQSRGIGKWDREAKRKKPTETINLAEVAQRVTLAHSHGTTSALSQSGAKRARVLILLHGQCLGEQIPRHFLFGVVTGRVYFLLGNPPTDRGCEGPGVGKGRGNVEGRLGGCGVTQV